MRNIHAAALGKLGRNRNTEAQATAARKNGKKGGRPGVCRHVHRSGKRCESRSVLRWTMCELHFKSVRNHRRKKRRRE